MKKIFSLLMILLVSFTLVSCKDDTGLISPDLPEDNKPLTPLEPSVPVPTIEEEIVNLIKTGINESLLDGDFALNGKAHIPKFTTPPNPNMPLLMTVGNINLNFEALGNLTTIEKSYVYVKLNVNLGGLFLGEEVTDSPMYKNIDLNYTFAYSKGFIYSGFESSVDENKDVTLESLLDFLGMFIEPALPEEAKPIYFMIKNILVEHKEKMFIGENQESFDLVFNTVSELLLLVNLINVEMITNSGLSFELNDDKQIIIITKGEDLTANMFDDFILNIIFEKDTFSSINGDFSLSLSEDLIITFGFDFTSNVTTNFDLSILDSYIEVEVLNIIKILNGDIIPIVPIIPNNEEEII